MTIPQWLQDNIFPACMTILVFTIIVWFIFAIRIGRVTTIDDVMPEEMRNDNE